MFKFLGIQHVNFIPEGKTEPMQGYSVHFSDDTANESLVGSVAFKCFFSYEKAAEVLKVRNPMEMHRFDTLTGKQCQLAFNRKGRIDGITFETADLPTTTDFPADPDAKGVKPNKLGGMA